MRVLFYIFFALTISVSAQTASLSRRQSAEIGNYEKALVNYRKAARFEVDALALSTERSARLHFNIGVCLYHLQRDSEAIEEFTRAIELSGGSYQKAFYALGMAQTELERFDEAEKSFQQALKLDQSDAEAWFDLALVYLAKKNLMAAQVSFLRSIKFGSRNAADAHNNLGVILALENDWSAAESEFETALRESDGASIEAKNNLLFCKYYRNDFKTDLTARLIFSRPNSSGE